MTISGNRHDVNPRSVADSQDLVGRATLAVAMLTLAGAVVAVSMLMFR
jgi:hypothetical protein